MSAGRLIAQVFAGGGVISSSSWVLPCSWWTWLLSSFPLCSHRSYTFFILSHSIFNFGSVVPLHLYAGIMLVVRQGQINQDFSAGGGFWRMEFSEKRPWRAGGAAAMITNLEFRGSGDFSFCERFFLCSGRPMVKLQLRTVITVNLRAIERHFAAHGKDMHQLRVFRSGQQ
jgi:hypothetical protein